MKKQLIIIGGGPAGLAAAVSAFDNGIRDILVLEREKALGGILNQCIHNGFGLHTFKEELTGPEYAERYIEEVQKRNITVKTETTVVEISEDKKVSYMSAEEGYVEVQADAVILACGCRERARGAVNIAGARVAGVFSAGTAQKLVNIDGLKVGSKVVVLGSGDIGLIMARRMTFEGCEVKAVVEIMPYSGGLNRNIVQCLNDFNIPLYFNQTVVEVKQQAGRVSAIVVADVDDSLRPKLETKRTIECDTLLLSVGLLPENELALGAGVDISPLTNGAVVDDTMMTNVDGIFQCGNVLHVHDLVDYVSEESQQTGFYAAQYIQGKKPQSKKTPVKTDGKVRYSVPQFVSMGTTHDLSFKLRVSNVFKNVLLQVRAGEEVVFSKKRLVVTPGEMEWINLGKEASEKLRQAKQIEVSLVEVQK